jgi:hypothetical protein
MAGFEASAFNAYYLFTAENLENEKMKSERMQKW